VPSVLVLAAACARELAASASLVPEQPGRLAHIVLGVGPRAASHGARAIARLRPRIVLLLGFSGGLRPGVTAGTVVLGTGVSETVASPLAPLPPVRELPHAERLRSPLARLPLRFAQGALLTVPSFIDRAEDKLQLGRHGPYLACDMESAVVAAACRAIGVPLFVVRAVSDGADEDVPPAPLSGEGGRLRSLRRAVAWGLQPGAPRDLWRLVRGGRRASRGLALVAPVVVEDLLGVIDGAR
jgi:nucleoside phosphorylase